MVRSALSSAGHRRHASRLLLLSVLGSRGRYTGVVLTGVMTTPDIPLLDISVWRHGTEQRRRELAARMDRALRQSGFLLIENHGVPAGLRQRIREEAGKFFALPAEQKRAYATPVGGRGWIPQGGEANAFYGEVADPARADLKESITNGRDFLTGDAAVDAQWFAPNVWPAECPDLAALAEEFTEQARAPLLRPAADGAAALGLDEEVFVLPCAARAADVQHQPLPATVRYRPGQRRPVPGRPAHRLGHPHDPGPAAGLRRPPGPGPRRHLGGRALRARRLHRERRRPAVPVDGRALAVHQAPGAAAAGTGTERGTRSP